MTENRTILAVDDDTDFLNTLVEILNSFGYRNVITAKDGNEAIKGIYKTSLTL